MPFYGSLVIAAVVCGFEWLILPESLILHLLLAGNETYGAVTLICSFLFLRASSPVHCFIVIIIIFHPLVSNSYFRRVYNGEACLNI